MKLAKNHIDVGLFSNQRNLQLAFWQHEVGLTYDHMGKLGGGVQQHRHHMNGSILKMNHARDPLPKLPASGYRELFIAEEGRTSSKTLRDPDGNPVTLVKPGTDGITGICMAMTVNNRDAFDAFYGEVMQFEEVRSGLYRCGDSLLWAREEGKVERVDQWHALGYRYITVQIFDAAHDHAGILARGGTEGAPLKVLGDTVRFSMVRDHDGNWIEISQRASLTGSAL